MGNPFIEKKEEKEKKCKLIGGNIPIHTAEYIRLSAIHKGTSVQGLLLSILTTWKVLDGIAPEKMFIDLADKAYQEWLVLDKKEKGKFIEYIEKTLSNLKLSEEYIKEITNRLGSKIDKYV